MTFADELRALPVLDADPPSFGEVTDTPEPAFRRWFAEAVAAGVRGPHEMTVSTVDADGRPDARVLILKDLDADGWWFTTDRGSAKGRQLAANDAAALTFWWRAVGRQVRVRGHVHHASPEASAAHFLARGRGARASALVGRQSEPLARRDELLAAVAEQLARIDEEPDVVAKNAETMVLRADEVELWQLHPERWHERVRWTRTDDGWTHTLLWP